MTDQTPALARATYLMLFALIEVLLKNRAISPTTLANALDEVAVGFLQALPPRDQSRMEVERLLAEFAAMMRRRADRDKAAGSAKPPHGDAP